MGFVWTDDPLVVGTTEVKALHINEMRTNLDTIYVFRSLNYGGCPPECGGDWPGQFPVADGDELAAADHNAVRDRMDFAHDNICGTDNATNHTSYHTTYHPGYDSTDHPSYHSSYHPGHDGLNHPNYHSGYQSIEYSPYHTSHDFSDEADNSTYHSTHLWNEEASYHVSYEVSFHSPHFVHHNTSDNNTYDGSEHVTYHSPYYGTYLPSNYDMVA